MALSQETQSTTAWATGATGEERLGSSLDSLSNGAVSVLHDRRVPRTRANIDHIAITPAGIWVIDAKRYQGRPQLRVEGGLFRPRVEKLYVGRRDCTALIAASLKQLGLVRAVAGDVPVVGVLCFVDADWPLVGGSFASRGVQVLWPKRLVKVLTEARVGPVDITEISAKLAAHFAPA